MKFGRKCKLSIEVNPVHAGNIDPAVQFKEGSNNIVIPPEFTVDFEITRQYAAGSQEATFRVYNLGLKTRNLLQKDPYVINEYRAIQFRAGYGQSLPLCFNGFVRSATSYRNGTDFITEISAYDGGLAMANGFTSQTFAQGTTVRDLLIGLAKSLPRIAGSPIVGDFPGTNTRGKVLFGNTWQIILQESGNLATIDNGQVKILNLHEAVNAPIPVITSDSGLLGSPRRTPTSLEFDMLFEPALTVAQLVQLSSRTQPLYNGIYKVAGFTHRGTISPVKAGDCQSSVLLFFGNEEFERVGGAILQ